VVRRRRNPFCHGEGFDKDAKGKIFADVRKYFPLAVTSLIHKMDESVFGRVPRDVRKMIFKWLGPSQVFRAQARGVCKSWKEDVPFDWDLVRDPATLEPEVRPMRWSLVETIIRMVLQEPDEVCARMDALVERFLQLSPDEKDELGYETLMVHLIDPACRLGKLSFLESLLCYAHLEQSSDGSLKAIPSHMLVLGRFFSGACMYNRPEWLLKWRHALWSQSTLFRLRVLWTCLFLGSKECFRVLLDDLKLSSECPAFPYDWGKLGKIFGAKQFKYLGMSASYKRDFVFKAGLLPSDRWLSTQLDKCLRGDDHDVAAYIDMTYAKTGTFTTEMQSRLLAHELVQGDSMSGHFVSGQPRRHGLGRDNDDGDDDDSSSSSDSSSGNRSNSNSDNDDDDDPAKACEWHPHLFCTWERDQGYIDTEARLLEYGRRQTQVNEHLREVMIAGLLEKKRAAEQHQRDLDAKRDLIKLRDALDKRRREARGGTVSLSRREFKKLRRAQFNLTFSTPRPVINPYEESLDSSEEARIRAEEDELEYDSGDCLEESDEDD
jgi:hypothetical protein